MQDQTGNNDLYLDQLSEEPDLCELTDEELEWVNGAGNHENNNGYAGYQVGVQYGEHYFGVDIGFGGR